MMDDHDHAVFGFSFSNTIQTIQIFNCLCQFLAFHIFQQQLSDMCSHFLCSSSLMSETADEGRRVGGAGDGGRSGCGRRGR